MSEQRTQSAPGLLICQQCGVVLKTQTKTCRNCGSVTSRYSTTLIPVLVINRKPATAPQHLKPENDPLIMERVVTRCKFNEAMRPKAKVFHGSRAFFNDQTHERANDEAPPNPAPVNNQTAAPQGEFDPFARTPAPGAGPTPGPGPNSVPGPGQAPALGPGPTPAPGPTQSLAAGFAEGPSAGFPAGNPGVGFPAGNPGAGSPAGLAAGLASGVASSPDAGPRAVSAPPESAPSSIPEGNAVASSGDFMSQIFAGSDGAPAATTGSAGLPPAPDRFDYEPARRTEGPESDFFADSPGNGVSHNDSAQNIPSHNLQSQSESSQNPLMQNVQPQSNAAQNPLMQNEQPQSDAVQNPLMQTESLSNSPVQSQPVMPVHQDSAPGMAPHQTSSEKVVRQAHPSYMVADSFLLVVQEHDGKTLSVTQTVDGPEQDPVFGLLPAPSTFNICSSQVMPDGSVSLSGESLSFHDANKEDEFSASPEVDLSVNIDSRLAFEEGLSRVAALRLQGALGRSGVLGFENSSLSDDEDIRKKFTRRPFSGSDSDDANSVAAADLDAVAAPPKPKERSVFKPKKAADVEKLEKIESIGDIKPIKPAKNPIAMVAAFVGIFVVVAVIGFVGYKKFNEFSSGGGLTSAASGGAALPKQWHVVLTVTANVKTIYQDFSAQIDQSGSNLSGKGRDAIGDFTLSGEIGKDNTLTMQKQYDSAGYIWPIVFSGKIAQSTDGSFASGTYVWRKSDQERIQGDWQASIPMAMPGQMPSGSSMQQPGMQQPGMQPGMQQPGMQPGMPGQGNGIR